MRRLHPLAIIGPGLLVAATGVGAGDLAGAGIAGAKLGVAVLWAVVVGALLKFALTEGLARWQIATGTTILEGACRWLGWPAKIIFVAYLLLWSFFVGRALMSACGVATQAIIPFPWTIAPMETSAETGKVIYGAAHSAIGLILVWLGGYRLFEKVMSAAVAVMFVSVVATALLIGPDWGEVGRGLIPSRPQDTPSLRVTIALIGGVGGTLTILSYGYWIRERHRSGEQAMGVCRIDLAVGYAFTAIFGMAMVIIASGITLDARGAQLLVELAARVEDVAGPAGRWVFLLGAWAAVASSLLGVWQSVPLIFADWWRLTAGAGEVSERSRPYRVYLIALALAPCAGLLAPFKTAQVAYTYTGAWFVPLLAVALLLLGGRSRWMGPLRNGPVATTALVVALALSAGAAWLEITG
ncbi:MAG: Nramp family divalent metal transporter [Phycisphaerales bacterium JB039]